MTIRKRKRSSLYDFLAKIPNAIRKPEPRKRAKGRKDRAEKVVKASVREQAVDRDGYCAVLKAPLELPVGMSSCSGPSQWAHVEGGQRARTRGQAPEVRHTALRSLMLCQKHHDLYDAGTIGVEFLDVAAGANGPKRFFRKAAKR